MELLELHVNLQNGLKEIYFSIQIKLFNSMLLLIFAKDIESQEKLYFRIMILKNSFVLDLIS